MHFILHPEKCNYSTMNILVSHFLIRRHIYWTCLVSNVSHVNAMPELLVENLSKRTEEGVPEEEVLTEELELLLPRLKEDDTEVSSRSSTSCS